MKKNLHKILKYLFNITFFLFFVVVTLLGITLFLHHKPTWRLSSEVTKEEKSTEQENRVAVDGKDIKTGLLDDKGIEVVIFNCTRCHSAKLITQNRANRQGWLAMIRWMQSSQNLWDLGENEKIILDYLEKNYAPEKQGRRKNLSNIEWYKLD